MIYHVHVHKKGTTQAMSSRGSALMGRTWVVPDALIRALKQRKVNSKKRFKESSHEIQVATLEERAGGEVPGDGGRSRHRCRRRAFRWMWSTAVCRVWRRCRTRLLRAGCGSLLFLMMVLATCSWRVALSGCRSIGSELNADYYAAACVRPGLFLISQQNR